MPHPSQRRSFSKPHIPGPLLHSISKHRAKKARRALPNREEEGVDLTKISFFEWLMGIKKRASSLPRHEIWALFQREFAYLGEEEKPLGTHRPENLYSYIHMVEGGANAHMIRSDVKDARDILKKAGKIKDGQTVRDYHRKKREGMGLYGDRDEKKRRQAEERRKEEEEEKEEDEDKDEDEDDDEDEEEDEEQEEEALSSSLSPAEFSQIHAIKSKRKIDSVLVPVKELKKVNRALAKRSKRNDAQANTADEKKDEKKDKNKCKADNQEKKETNAILVSRNPFDALAM